MLGMQSNVHENQSKYGLYTTIYICCIHRSLRVKRGQTHPFAGQVLGQKPIWFEIGTNSPNSNFLPYSIYLFVIMLLNIVA